MDETFYVLEHFDVKHYKFLRVMKRFEHANVIFKFIFHYDVLSMLLTSLSTQMVFILKFIMNVIYKPSNFMIYTTSLKKIL